jgi:hypothetical protein
MKMTTSPKTIATTLIQDSPNADLPDLLVGNAGGSWLMLTKSVREFRMRGLRQGSVFWAVMPHKRLSQTLHDEV